MGQGTLFWIWWSASISLIWAMSQMKWGNELRGPVGNVCWEDEKQMRRSWSRSTLGFWRNQTLLKSEPVSGVQGCRKTSLYDHLFSPVHSFIHLFQKHFSRSLLCAKGYLHTVTQRCQGIALFSFILFPKGKHLGPFSNTLKRRMQL